MKSNRLLAASLATGLYVAPLLAGDDPCKVAPEFIGEYRTPATANQVQVDNGIAYVVDWFPVNSLQIINVSDTASPFFLGSMALSTFPVGFAVENETVFLPGSAAGLRIIDVSNPGAPVQVGSYAGIGPTRDVVVNGTTAYVAMTNSLHIIDVNSPSSPVLVGTSGTLLAAVEFVAVSGSTIYAADFLDGVIQVFDASDPSSPAVVGSYTGINFATDIAASGSMVYVTDFTGLHIIDASDPTDPVSASFTSIGIAKGIAVDGTTGYIAGGNGLVIVDASDPSTPQIIGTFHTPQASRGIDVVGDTVFVADDSFGLQIIDVTSNCNDCIADFTGDGMLDIFDLFAFIEAFNSTDPSADFTSDGMFDIFDVLAFIQQFNDGCP